MAKRISVGLLAHVDAGKTTLGEALMYASGNLKKPGRVDHGSSFLDTDAQERARGITIFSKQAIMPRNDTVFTLLDTPGHVDFSAETERTLQVLDYAVLVVSGTDGVQSHTLTLWKLLERYRVPVFLFISRSLEESLFSRGVCAMSSCGRSNQKSLFFIRSLRIPWVGASLSRYPPR